MSNSDMQFSSANPTSENDDIDLRQLAFLLSRHRTLVAVITGASLLLSGLYAFTRKPVWEGRFQIVLEQKDSDNTSRLSQIASVFPAAASLGSLSSYGGNRLETEVKVLKSPSVLQPTYEFVKEKKKNAGINVSNWTFRGWRDSKLKVELQKGTSVLDITYLDTVSEHILPVMQKISRDYQHYSGRDRSKSILNGLSFAEEQVRQFRKTAETSSRELDAFSIRYGISSSRKSLGNSGIDVSQLVNSTSSSRSMSPIGSSSINGTMKLQGDAYNKLASINQELIRRQQRFTKQDPGVRALVRERDALRTYIEITAGGNLTLPGTGILSKEQAQELILKFKQLNRKATRDAATLDSLERSLLSLRLEQARQTDPWELISTPTLSVRPVSPRKGRILAIGLLTGVIAGSAAALLLDRRTDLVFSIEELKSSLPCPLLRHLPALTSPEWNDVATLLAKGPLATDGISPIALLPVGNIPGDQLQAFASKLRHALGTRELIVSSDLSQTSACSTQLLLTAPGVATRRQLSELNEKYMLQGTPLAGWVLLDPALTLS